LKNPNICGFTEIIPYILNRYNQDSKISLLLFLNRIKKKVDYLIWFDHNDSTGNTHFEVLPYVDLYLKRQLLKDRSFYTKKVYKNETRIYVDYYEKNYSINEERKPSNNVPLNRNYMNKIDISWNLAYCDYRYSNLIERFMYGFMKMRNIKYTQPRLNRKLLFSANYGIDYKINSITFQRKNLLKILKKIMARQKEFH